MKKFLIIMGLMLLISLTLQQQKPDDEDCPCKDEDGECIPCPEKPK